MSDNSEAFGAVPAELRERAQWVVWRREQREGGTTKVPYCPVDPTRRASTTSPTTWGTFTQALAVYQAGRADGVGFVFSADDPYCGVDFDHCRDAGTGAVQQWARDIVEKLGSYTEVSPSGTGLHVIVRAKLPAGGNRKGQLEMYDRERFFCMTGLHAPGTRSTIEDRHAEITSIHEEVFGRPGETTDKALAAGASDGPALDDEEVLVRLFSGREGQRAAALYRGDKTIVGNDDSVADYNLCILVLEQTSNLEQVERLMRRSKLARPKWDERRGEETYLGRTVRKALVGRRTHRSRVSTPSAVKVERPFLLQHDVYGLELGHDLEPNWNVKGWFPNRDISFLIGAPKSMKSWIGYDLAVSLAGGYPFLGRYPVLMPGPVFLVNQEDQHRTVLTRLALIQAAREGKLEALTEMLKANPSDAGADKAEAEFVFPGLRQLDLYVHPWREFSFTDPAALERLRERIAALRPRWVIIDPLVRTLPTDDYMQKAEQQMQVIKRYRDEFGCGFLIVHHSKKDVSGGVVPWGSQFLESFRETKITVRRTGRVITVERSFREAEEPEPINLEFDISTEAPFRYEIREVAGSAEEPESKALANARRLVRDAVPIGRDKAAPAAEIRKTLERTIKDGEVRARSTVDKHLKLLVKSSDIYVIEDGKDGKDPRYFRTTDGVHPV